MIDTELEAAVTEMLHRRAADVPDDVEPAVATSAEVHAVEPTSRSARWRVLVVVAAAIVVVSLVVVTNAGDDDDQVETVAPVTGEPDGSTAEVGRLSVFVRQHSATPYPNGSLAVMEATDENGTRIGEVLVAPPADVYDPDAEPGSVGSDLETSFPPLDVDLGSYHVAVWQYVCPRDGCPVGQPTQEVLAAERADLCEIEVAVDTPLGYLNQYGELDEGKNIVAVSTPGQGCDYIGPFTEEHDQAATDLLMHQVANGWVPYGGEPALEGAVWPASVEEVWGPANSLLEDPGCSRPSGISAMVDFSCLYDEADGEIIGYHFSVLGYVPVDRIDEFDPDRAFFELWGCSPMQDPTCQARHDLEQARAQLSSDDLPPEQREMIEQLVAELEQRLEAISE